MDCVQCGGNVMFLENESCNVCRECGIVRQVLTVSPAKFGENVNVCVYSRSKRFEIMLKALLYPAFDCKDEIMFKHLTQRPSYSTLGDLRSEMKRCKVKEKRFHSLHLFATLLCPTHKSPKSPARHYFKRIMYLFDELLCAFNSKRRIKFFSYPWLIRKLLNITGEHRYDRYIKRIRCKKRNYFYKRLFDDLVRDSPPTYLIRECGTIKCG